MFQGEQTILTWKCELTVAVACVVPEFGSGSGRNPANFANPAEIRLRPNFGRISAGAGFLISAIQVLCNKDSHA